MICMRIPFALKPPGFKYSTKEKSHPTFACHSFSVCRAATVIVSLPELVAEIKGVVEHFTQPGQHQVLHKYHLLVVCWVESFGWLFQVDVLTSEWHLWNVSKTNFIDFTIKNLLRCTYHSPRQANFVVIAFWVPVTLLPKCKFSRDKISRDQGVERCCTGVSSQSYFSH